MKKEIKLIQLKEADYNNMALFELKGDRNSIKKKVREWDKRNLRFRDIKEINKNTIQFKANVFDFEEE